MYQFRWLTVSGSSASGLVSLPAKISAFFWSQPALRAAWLKKKQEVFAGKLTKPDAEDPETVNHLNWYMATGFTRPYPGEKKVRPPSDFNKPAPDGDMDDK